MTPPCASGSTGRTDTATLASTRLPRILPRTSPARTATRPFSHLVRGARSERSMSTPALSQAGQSSHDGVVTPHKVPSTRGDARIRCPGAEINLPFPLLATCVSFAVPVSDPQAPVLAGEATTAGDMASVIAELRREGAVSPAGPSPRHAGTARAVSRSRPPRGAHFASR